MNAAITCRTSPPIGVAHIKAVQAARPLTKAEWDAGVGYAWCFAVAGLGAPNFFMRDQNSPHVFTAAQPACVHRRADGPPRHPGWLLT